MTSGASCTIWELKHVVEYNEEVLIHVYECSKLCNPNSAILSRNLSDMFMFLII
jgi:hypothetical protein